MFNSDTPLAVGKDIITNSLGVRNLLHKYIYSDDKLMQDLDNIISGTLSNVSFNPSKREFYADSLRAILVSECIFKFFNNNRAAIIEKINQYDHIDETDIMYLMDAQYNRMLYDIMIINKRCIIKL